MYPAGFQYERAGTVEEAVDFLIEYAGSEIELLAGGYSLLPTMKVVSPVPRYSLISGE